MKALITISLSIIIILLGSALVRSSYELEEHKRLLNTANDQLILVSDKMHSGHTNKYFLNRKDYEVIQIPTQDCGEAITVLMELLEAEQEFVNCLFALQEELLKR